MNWPRWATQPRDHLIVTICTGFTSLAQFPWKAGPKQVDVLTASKEREVQCLISSNHRASLRCRREPAYESAPPPPPPAGMSPYQGPGAPVGYGQPGPIGQVRSTGMCILLYFVTLGIYVLYWYFKTHEEMKRHSRPGPRRRRGADPRVLRRHRDALHQLQRSRQLCARQRAQRSAVSAATGLWYFPGALILVGPFIWFIKTNDALNDYWRSQGAVG